MSFKNIKVNHIYRNSSNKILEELVIPLLCESKNYYRGVGFFTSSWIQLVCSGLKDFAESGGKIFLITSPKISESDWEAINIGNKAKFDEVLYNTIKKEVDNNFSVKSKYECLNLFSWLISDNILNLKFAICKNKRGIYHDKIAIFEDSNGDKICMHGSFNDSEQATYNGESMSVFKSWIGDQNIYVEDHFREFMNMWTNNSKFYDIVDAPDIIIKEFNKYKSGQRPYKCKNKKNLHLPKHIEKLNIYQEEAINSLINNEWCGILEMATGTGKTITSLAASKKYYERKNRIFLVVIVPFTHLIPQWESNIISFGYKIPIKCFNNKSEWFNILLRKIRNFNSRIDDTQCVITTYTTFSSKEFQRLIKKVKKDVVLIADECHYAGSPNLRDKFEITASAKIGLSATPDRWFDEEGTSFIKDYFKGTTFEYTLEDAIKNGFLTEYIYTPIAIELTTYEYDKYKTLTKRIYNLIKNKSSIDDEQLQKLVLLRSELISKAENKIPIFLEMIKTQFEKGQIDHTLVYCGKGQSKEIVGLLSKIGIRVHEFTYEVSNKERQKVLDAFNEGHIQVLVAMKCLDEGVDVPSTKNAYFISSTSNPREFIQRRGRILRKFKGKNKSNLYDYIVIPPVDSNSDNIDKSIIEKEMPRFAEFSKYAINEYTAKNYMRKYLKDRNLEYLMEKLPWEIYMERKEKFLNE